MQRNAASHHTDDGLAAAMRTDLLSLRKHYFSGGLGRAFAGVFLGPPGLKVR